MTGEFYIMTVLVAIVVMTGLILSGKSKKKMRDKYSIISRYNHLLDRYVNVYQNIANQYNEKVILAEKYNDRESLDRFRKLHNETARTAESIEKKLCGLNADIAGKNFAGVSLDALFKELNVIESLVAELADIAVLIRSIHPAGRSDNFRYEYENFAAYNGQYSSKPWKASRFFSSCNTKEELTKRYRELAKIYHPDNTTTGNVNTFKSLKDEYDEYNKQ